MVITVSTPSRNTIHLRWQGIRVPKPGTPPIPVPLASRECQQACPSPTSTPLWGQALTAYTTTASALCWAWVAALSSSASGSSSVAHSATPVLSLTRNATAASAAIVSRMATFSLTKTARRLPLPLPTTPSPPHRTQTSPGPFRSACRPTSDLQRERGFDWGATSRQDCKTVKDFTCRRLWSISSLGFSSEWDSETLSGPHAPCNLL